MAKFLDTSTKLFFRCGFRRPSAKQCASFDTLSEQSLWCIAFYGWMDRITNPCHYQHM